MRSDEYDELNRDPQVVDNLAYLDSVLGKPLTPPASTEADKRARFERIFSSAVAQAADDIARTRRHGRRRFIAALAGVTATAVAAFTGWAVIELPHRRPAYAATPQRLDIKGSAFDAVPATLQQLAQQADQVSDKPAAVDHLVIDRWDLNSIIDGAQVTSAVIPYRSELWRSRDDAARVINTYLAPQFPTDADREAWRDAGSPSGGKIVSDYRAREYQGAFPGRPPSDPADLATWLARGAISSTAILQGTADLLIERALTGRERGALLRVLATHTSLTFAGTAVDRAGRTGLAFTSSSDDHGGHVTDVLLIDPRTGSMLASERILTEGADALNVLRPAVISYRTYLLAEQVPAIP